MSRSSKLVSLVRTRRTLFAALALVVVSAASTATRAQDRPLQTADAEVVVPGSIRAQVGFDFLQEANFPLSALSGDLANYGVVNIRMGVGRIIEVQIQGMIQQFLTIKSQGASFVPLNLPSANSTHDIGDFMMWTKIRLLDESDRRPALALRFGYGMPNSNQSRGIGLNATNIFGEVILEKHFGRLAVFGDLGLGILTSPNALFSQNDEILYGAAFRYAINRRYTVVGEVAGRMSTRTIIPALVGTESHGQGRLGLQINAGGLIWDFAGIAGLNKNDARAGFTFGVSKDFQLFNWNKM